MRSLLRWKGAEGSPLCKRRALYPTAKKKGPPPFSPPSAWLPPSPRSPRRPSPLARPSANFFFSFTVRMRKGAWPVSPPFFSPFHGGFDFFGVDLTFFSPRHSVKALANVSPSCTGFFPFLPFLKTSLPVEEILFSSSSAGWNSPLPRRKGSSALPFFLFALQGYRTPRLGLAQPFLFFHFALHR